MNKFGSPDKMYVVDIIPVKDHKAVENAVKNMLSDYTYIKGKEYFNVRITNYWKPYEQ